jgi:hypothetical protein
LLDPWLCAIAVSPVLLRPAQRERAALEYVEAASREGDREAADQAARKRVAGPSTVAT